MSLKRFSVLLVVVFSIALLSFGSMQAQEPTIVDIAAGDGNFTVLVAALQAAGLDDDLAGPGPFTVFAPTDAVFEALLAATGVSAADLLASPVLDNILLYHVVAGNVLAADVIGLDGSSVDTLLSGTQISISVNNGTVNLNDTVTVTTTDIVGSNGVIHVIDTVLIPPATPAADNINFQAPTGTIQTIGNPIYEWIAVEGATEYQIYVGANNGTFLPANFFGVVNAADVCFGNVCAVDLTTQTNALPGASPWLANGSYAVFMNATGQLADWKGPFTFDVATPQPAAQTITGVSGGNTINWTLEGDAVYSAFFYMYLAPRDNLAAPVVNEWVTRQDACGSWEGTTCAFPVDGLMEGTNYGLYTQSYGAGGFSTGGNIPGLDGWVECNFEPSDGRCLGAVTEPTNLAATPSAGSATLTWTAAENATEYTVWVGTISPVNQAYFDTVSAADLICAMGGTCTLVVSTPSSGTYSWFVLAQGPSGVPQNDLLGWVIGDNFEGNGNTIVDIAVGNQDFSTLVTALQTAGLVNTLNGAGPFTVFAPTNAAFEALLQDLNITVDELLARPDLADILTYHVVPGAFPATDVIGLDGQSVTTVQGGDISISIVDGGVVLNDAVNVVDADIFASNGVIHVIDAVLLPPSQ